MEEQRIAVTDYDLTRLLRVIHTSLISPYKNKKCLDDLMGELRRADVVPSREIPRDAVTMNSRVRIKDLQTGEEEIFTLVFPGDANIDQGKISVFSPIGTALLGYRAGDAVEWRIPAGLRKIRIEEILYQPEAAGDFHL